MHGPKNQFEVAHERKKPFIGVKSDQLVGYRKVLVGGLEHVLCFHVLGMIIPIDELIFFQRGRYITNQSKCSKVPTFSSKMDTVNSIQEVQQAYVLCIYIYI